ncbi:MAG: hypothetical protein AAFY98_02870, partial [Verrucomicrobiota bacterium]
LGVTQIEFLKIRHLADGNQAVIGDLGACQVTNLQELNLSNTQISELGLGHMEPLHELRKINLTGTPLSGKANSALQDLAQLKSVYLSDTLYTPEDIVKLHEARPGLQITFEQLPAVQPVEPETPDPVQ